MRRLRGMALRQGGFSMVELLVALFFTGVLMAGLAKVYQASIQSFRTEGEKISSGRRNRLAREILSDDLNGAGQTLTNISFHKAEAPTPLFEIVPDNTAATPLDERKDVLRFHFEDPLPFEGRLMTSTGTGPGGLNNAIIDSNTQLVQGATVDVSALDPVKVNFSTAAFRDALVTAVNTYKNTASPIKVIFKDQYRVVELSNAAADGDTAATLTFSGEEDTSAGSFSLTTPLPKPDFRHVGGTGAFDNPAGGGPPMVFVRSDLLITYQIENVALDPSSSSTVPCLVKTVAPYATPTVQVLRTVVAEDVTGMKIYLSADGGRTWVGQGATYSTWDAMKLALDIELRKVENLDRTAFLSQASWYRFFPVLLRMDLTTRTAVARQQTKVGGAPVFKKTTQVLVAAPRYFGLPLTSH